MMPIPEVDIDFRRTIVTQIGSNKVWSWKYEILINDELKATFKFPFVVVAIINLFRKPEPVNGN